MFGKTVNYVDLSSSNVVTVGFTDGTFCMIEACGYTKLSYEQFRSKDSIESWMGFPLNPDGYKEKVIYMSPEGISTADPNNAYAQGKVK